MFNESSLRAVSETVYLNVAAPDVTSYLKTNREGRVLAPAGSPRDLFLHVVPERLDEAREYVGRQVAGTAEVHSVRDLIEDGLFGVGEPSPTFLGRVGDLVVLPYKGESVWWCEQGRFEQRYRGHHGGLTREELEILLLAQSYP